MEITLDSLFTDVLDIPSLSEIRKYLTFSTAFPESMRGHETVNSIREIMKISPHWNPGSMLNGLQALRNLGEKQSQILYPIYGADEIARQPELKNAAVMYFPAGTDTAPYSMILAGGAFRCVCSLAEGFSTAAQINKRGYHAFVVNYRVGLEPLMPKPIDDLARAIAFIRKHHDMFHVKPDRYAVIGFSAGGNIICTYCSDLAGYAKYGLPKPEIAVPVYAATRIISSNNDVSRLLYGNLPEPYQSQLEILPHCSNFPPSYIVACLDDHTVPPDHAYHLSRALAENGIPHHLEFGAHGGHGFGTGEGTSVSGWTNRAIDFWQKISEDL